MAQESPGSPDGEITPEKSGLIEVPCSAKFAPGTLVALTPVPKRGKFFNGWSGDCSGTQPCSLLMDRAHTVAAGFIDPPSLKPADIVLTVSPTSPLAGEPISVLAVVSGTNLSGTISFLDGELKKAEAPLINGQALATLNLPEGTHSIRATYTAIPSGFSVTSLPFSLVVRKAGGPGGPDNPFPFALLLTAESQQINLREAVRLVASPLYGRPTGVVTFYANDVEIGSEAFASDFGDARFAYVFPAAGTYTIIAKFAGNDKFPAAQSNPISVSVRDKTESTTVLTIDPAKPFTEESFTLTATVAGDSPTGTIRFVEDVTLDMSNAPIIMTGGVATLTAQRQQGTYRFIAYYSGDDNNWPSISNQITVEIGSIWSGPPPSPNSLNVTGDVFLINLNWTMPYTGDYAGTEVWVSQKNSIDTATKVGSVASSSYSFVPDAQGVFYFWIRNRDQEGILSDFYPVGSGVRGATGTWP